MISCAKPKAPTVVPKESRVTAIGPAGIDVVVKVEATNPNTFTISTRSVTAKAKLDGRWDMGTVTIPHVLVLPPSTPTTFDMPMHLNWTDVQALGSLAMTPKPVPYVIEGTVNVGGESLNVDVPFTVSGTITREQIVQTAMKGLPKIPILAPPPP